MKKLFLSLITTAALATVANAQAAPRYNQIHQKHTHNAYQRDESLLDQMLYYSVRSIELDIHPSFPNGDNAPAGDWAVWHEKDSAGTSCKLLSQCLDRVAAFSQAIPQHEVVTIWIEMKEAGNFDSTHTPDQFDALLSKKLGDDHLFTASYLLGQCPSAGGNLARSVLSPCAWPELSSLRGKFAAVLLGDGAAEADYKDAKYPAQRVAFLQGGASGFDPSNPTSKGVIFFNTDIPSQADEVTAGGYVTRITTANDQDNWSSSVEYRAQFIGTDKVNDIADAWARTSNLRGWPFRCTSTDCTCTDEGASYLHISALTQDISGSADNFIFLYEPQTSEVQKWSAFVSAPDSHVEPWAKGCLMARQDTTPGSPYFAVCRPADTYPIQVQYRQATGGATEVRQLSIGAQDSDQSIYLTLVTSPNGSSGTCVEGYAALDPLHAPGTLIHRQCFASTLSLQGLGASSNTADPSIDDQPIRLLFVSPTHQTGQNPARVYGMANFTQANIGNVHSQSSAGDGMFPTEGFAWQTVQGSRTYGVGYNGKSEWLVDVTGDGRVDYVYNRDGTRELWVLPGTGSGFGPERRWGTRDYGVGYGGRSEWLADVNGDGRADYIYNRDGTREMHVLLSTGTVFADEQTWGSRANGVGYDGRSEWFADVNGDGKADHVYNRDGTRELRVRISTGSGFKTDSNWGERSYGVGYEGGSEWLVDVSGDGRADYVYNHDGTRELRALVSTGSFFGTDRLWRERTYGVGYDGQSQWLVDVSGDGRADYVYNRDGTRELRVMTSNGLGFDPDVTWGERKYGVGFDGRGEWLVDLDGDGKVDHLYNSDGTREYWAMHSTGSAFESDVRWGVRDWGVGYNGNSEWLVDVDGDGRLDQLNNREGGREFWGMQGRTCDAGSVASAP